MALVPIRNVINFRQTLRELDPSHDQMVLVFGPPGAGKTHTCAHTFVQYNGILLNCLAGLSQRALLILLAKELRLDLPRVTNGEMLLHVLEAIRQNPRPLFIDEADRLFKKEVLFETIRDIHDQCRIPVIMMGASSSASFAGVDQHLRRYPQMADRVSHWLHFAPVNLDDLIKLQNHYLPKLELSPGLQQRLLRESQGNVRRIKAGFINCRAVARRKKIATLTEADMGKAEIISLDALAQADGTAPIPLVQ